MLHIDAWPLRGPRLSGTSNMADVGAPCDALLEHPEGGAVAIHKESLSQIEPEATDALKDRLDRLWDTGEARRVIYLRVVRSDVADTLIDAGFEERVTGPQELVHMTPR